MKHKKVDIKFALQGCRLCAGAILMKLNELDELLANTTRDRHFIKSRLEEITR